MYQALDPATELWIHASSPNARRRGLVCPRCRQPVLKRAGAFRATHFAHVSGKADPSCEFYVAQYGAAPAWRPNVPTTTEAEPRPSQSGEPALYLKVDAQLNSSLQLFVPRLRASSESDWTGKLVVSGKRGETTLSPLALRKDCYVEVSAQQSTYRVRSEGDVPSAYSLEVGEVAGLRDGVNVFRTSEYWGRRVGRTEAVHWGDTIWALCPAPLQSLFASELLKLLTWYQLKFEGGWFAYEVSLPDVKQIRLSFIGDEIRKVLGVRIRERSARILLVDPLPHHFSELGEFVVSAQTAPLKLFRSEPLPLAIEAIEGEHNVRVEELADDLVELTGYGIGLLQIRAYGAQDILIRVSECDFRVTDQIKFSIAGSEVSPWLLNTKADLQRMARYQPQSVDLHLPHPYLLRATYLNGASWTELNRLHELLGDAKTVLELQVGNYVQVELRPMVCKQKEEEGPRSTRTQSALFGRLAYRAFVMHVQGAQTFPGTVVLSGAVRRPYAAVLAAQLRAAAKKGSGGGK